TAWNARRTLWESSTVPTFAEDVPVAAVGTPAGRMARTGVGCCRSGASAASTSRSRQRPSCLRAQVQTGGGRTPDEPTSSGDATAEAAGRPPSIWSPHCGACTRRAVADGYREPGDTPALTVDIAAPGSSSVVDIETLGWFYQLNSLPI